MKQQLNEDELFFGLCIIDIVLFTELYFHEDISLGLSVKQRIMFLDESSHKLLCCGRKCAKTVYIEAVILQSALTMRGEGLFFTPGFAHITPVRSRITSKINHNPLFSSMLDSFNKNDGIMSFRKGEFIWHWRIEGTDGTDKNMVGLRASIIVGDELAFGTMVCHQSRGQVALPKCKWIYAGVPNAWHSGILYALDQTPLGDSWSRNRLTSYDNPLYYGREQELIDLYRGENTWEYQTQVLGKWGGELERSFPPGTVSIKEGVPFVAQTFIANLISSNTNEIPRLLRIPKVDAKNYVIGIDYGFSPDPTELLIFYEKGEEESNEWVELARIQMKAVIASHQGMVVHAINEFLGKRVRAICVEYVSGGVGIVQELQRTDTNLSPGSSFPYGEVCVNANPGGTIDVPTLTLQTTEQMVERGIPDFSYASQEHANEQGLVRVYRKVWMTHELRDAGIRANQNISGVKIHISGEDIELQQSIMNVLEKKTANGNTVYDKIDKTIPDHPVDAARCVMCAIDHFNSKRRTIVEEDDDISCFGWVKGSFDNGAWRSPWK